MYFKTFLHPTKRHLVIAFVCDNFPRGCTKFRDNYEFSRFREFPEYSRFSRLVVTLSGLGVEIATWVLKNSEPGETRTFCQPRNLGLGSLQNPQVLGLRFCMKALCLMEYYTILDISKHVFD